MQKSNDAEARRSGAGGEGNAGATYAGRGPVGRAVKAVRAAVGPAELIVGLALSCMLAWAPMSFQSLNILSDAGEPVLDLIYLVSIVALTATLAAVGVAHRACAPVIARQGVRIAAALAMAASVAVMPLAAASPDAIAAAGGGPAAPTALQAGIAVASGAVSGVASGVFLMQFGILVSKFPSKSVVAVTAIGYVVSSGLFCLYSFFGTMESCVFAASMPLVSAFLRDMGAATPQGKRAIAEKAMPAQAAPADLGERRGLNHLIAALATCAALVGCENELARTLYIQMGIAGIGNNGYALIQAGASLIVGFGAVVLTLALISMRTPRTPEYCYRILMLFLAIGALLLPVPLLYPQVSAIIPYAINAATYQCFSLLAWVLVCGACQRYLGSCVRVFALVRAGWAAGPLAGMLAGRLIVGQTAFDAAAVYPAAVAGVVLVMACGGFAFTERDLAFAVNLLPLERRRRFTDKCLAVAARCGLSERETEIMTLFAKGRNLAYIQEQLCLSKSTVSTHRQHIYQKLDVHSSQEMIDLIQAEQV